MKTGKRALKVSLPLQRSMGLVLSWLIIVNVFALIASNRLNLLPDTALDWMSPETFKPVQSWDIINLHNHWDAYWYLTIAEHGYQLWGDNNQANVVFFPLYPLLMLCFKPLCGGDLVLAGWIVSSLFLCLSAFILTRLTQEFHPEIDDPLLPTIFMLAYPTAFYLNAVYSESVFLFFSLAAVLYALRRNFAIAAMWVALASATRIAGVFLCVFLVIEFVQAHGAKSLLSGKVWPLAIAPLGALLFFGYHWFKFGDFFLYFKIERNFGRAFNPDASFFDIRNNPDLVHTILECFYTIAAVALGVIALVRVRLSYGLYMLTCFGIALSSGTTLGLSRYSMVMFPIYLIAGSIRSFVGRTAWLLASTLLCALNIIRFVNNYWAG